MSASLACGRLSTCIYVRMLGVSRMAVVLPSAYAKRSGWHMLHCSTGRPVLDACSIAVL